MAEQERSSGLLDQGTDTPELAHYSAPSGSHTGSPELAQYTDSPRATRRAAGQSLQPSQQETSFSTEPQRRDSAPTLTITATAESAISNGDSAPNTRAARGRVAMDEVVEERTIVPHPEEIEEEQRQQREESERVELVSKQSRPFLLFKIVEFLFAALLVHLALHTWPVILVRGNIHSALFLVTACCTFLIYCPCVFFGYLAQLNTPAAVMLMLDVLGAVYFTVSAAFCGVYWSDLEWLITKAMESGAPVLELEHVKQALAAAGADTDVHIVADKLLMSSLLCCSAAAMYIGDVVLTLKYLVYRKVPLITKPWPFMRVD